MAYRFLEHMADVKFSADGPTIEEMFVSALDALNETIRGNIKILEQEKKSFEVEGKDRESLLYNFLEEFLFLLDSEDFLTAKIESVKIKDNKLNCVVVGDSAEKYKFTNDVKAITYNDMFVREKGRRFECQVVLDV